MLAARMLSQNIADLIIISDVLLLLIDAYIPTGLSCCKNKKKTEKHSKVGKMSFRDRAHHLTLPNA